VKAEDYYGTHAVEYKKIFVFDDVGLVVIDEQHRLWGGQQELCCPI
jgi:RecG-like helicase